MWNLRRIGKITLSLVLPILLIGLLVAAAPMATRYIFGGLVIQGTGDQTQLRVTGWTTQTSDLLVVEQSDGTDVLTVTNAGALSYSGASSFNGDTTIAGILLVDGQADAVQLTAQGYITQTSDLFVVELSDGTNVLDVDTNGMETQLPIVASAMYWFDDFIGSTVMAMYTEVSGSDAEAVQTIVEEQFGVYQITSGDVGSGVAADLEAVYLSLEWQADQGALIFEARLHLDTDVATVELCAGFTDDVATVELPFTNSADTVTAVADDAIMLCFDTGATTDEWWVNGAAGGTEATGIAATGVVPVADVYQVIRIEVDDGGEDCRFYVDGVLVGTLTANCVTNTDLLAPGVVISSGGAAVSNVVDVDYILAGAARD